MASKNNVTFKLIHGLKFVFKLIGGQQTFYKFSLRLVRTGPKHTSPLIKTAQSSEATKADSAHSTVASYVM